MTRWIALGLVAVAAIVAGVALGPADLGWAESIGGLLGRGDETVVAIVQQLRAPRVLLAFLVGGCLAVTGAALQALVRNPLADPYLLGLSGGAGVGAVLAIALRLGGAWAVPAAAFVGVGVLHVLSDRGIRPKVSRRSRANTGTQGSRT